MRTPGRPTTQQDEARKQRWENSYSNKDSSDLSWYQPHLELSLKLIERTGSGKAARIIDVGAGSSTLVDDLLMAGYRRVTALDISLKAIEGSKARLGAKAKHVTWIEGDIERVELPPAHFDIWHDRAVFHFLTSDEGRKRYVNVAKTSLKSDGHLIIGTFAQEGPTRCSGMDVIRYSAHSITAEFGEGFELVESAGETHRTPYDAEQKFMYFRFIRRH
jgi:ubiquinone/menaquinone biosynthesis C-methylase UbiE